jgi:hypothetical protein
MRLSLILLALAMMLPGALLAQSVTFTGDVDADFPATTFFADAGVDDVGMPPSLVNFRSGWDLSAVALSYDAATDTLFVGFNAIGILGDADGEGDPGFSNPGLLINGGVDRPNFEGTEAFTLSLDLDNDGMTDVIAGLPIGEDLSGFTVATFDPFFELQPLAGFDVVLPDNVGIVSGNTSATSPDIEFTITNFAALLADYVTPDQTEINLTAFAGSLEDDGIGEDFIDFSISLDTFEDDEDPEECTPEFWKNNPDLFPAGFSGTDPLYWDFNYCYLGWYGLQCDDYSDALCYPDGDGSLVSEAKCLVREAAAGVLNRFSNCVQYPYGYWTLRCWTNYALWTCDINMIQYVKSCWQQANEDCVFECPDENPCY